MDTQQGENQTAEVPATDIPQSESDEQVVDQQQAQQQENPEIETGKNEVGDVPKENAAWAAQRVANKQLQQENARLKQVLTEVDPSYLESLQGAVSPRVEQSAYRVPQLPEDADYQQVTQGVNWANSQVVRANNELSRMRQQLELQQDREAERAYPELKSDKVFQQIVAEKKLAARVLGHDRTTLEIAEEVSSLLGKREEMIAARASQQTKDQILQRQAISTEPKGQTTAGRPQAHTDELRYKVRRGDQEAQTQVAKNLIADLEF